ncbi:uncharacterized protein PHALS_03132 [Plasmopara halstedii]|uniref:Uncharacterized protein n=1 Tax=Plasmopara halstedii TaxID=4781 RepID=A0A0N7L3R2_PLAHL|nr:uncharacterized protein PHALS_03132 [Plasmopara halstedii]CEG36587.1 hypothetical protein PHALS_03132 [Plasmopara halstedii]|eukprot:XP_024572956.1 hypothetical protein PHALS_03132 [Plasmopara halstedii]
MAHTKQLDLSKSRDDESSSASSSGDEQEKHATTQDSEEENESGSDEESEAEFEIPPGFERVKGSGAVTREAFFHNEQELWFFKLPRNLDASVLANVTIKMDENKAVSLGESFATVTAGSANKKSNSLRPRQAVFTVFFTCRRTCRKSISNKIKEGGDY